MDMISSALAELDSGSIVIVSAILLACGSLGLIAVRLNNPRLLGLGWLGGAYLSGLTGASLLVLGPSLPKFYFAILSDFMLLLSFVLVHESILTLRKARNVFPKFGALLLFIQLAGYLWMTYVFPNAAGKLVLMGVLVIAQVVQTIMLLLSEAKPGARLPAWFSAAILSGFVAVNLFRSILLVFFQASTTHADRLALQKVVFLVYLITAMGLAFNSLWMTTAELSEEVERMAGTDPLTRIYNRRVFRDWCEREYLRSRQKAVPFSLLMMDLDHFKEINDRYGHHGGDAMLVAVVEAMQDSIRGIDVLGRWGGEEFVALLPGANGEAAVMVAQRVRSHIERLVLPTGMETVAGGAETMRMTLSLGVATYRGLEDGLDDMFRRADEALYGAKAAGRNQVLATV